MVRQPNMAPVFILAGGVGERLSPLTQSKPKPAVSFGGVYQIIDFTVSNCINSGLRKIFVVTQHLREPLHDYVRQTRLRHSGCFRLQEGDDLRPAPPVSGKRYRGTADAVFQNLPLIRFESAEHVVIASGDHVYAMDYRPLLARHCASGADLTIAVARRPGKEASAFGVLDVEGGVAVDFREKPSSDTLPPDKDVFVSMGVYVFRRRALLDIADSAPPSDTDFGHDIIPALIRRQKVAVYDFDATPQNYWRDVGSLDSYFQANMDLLGSDPVFNPEMNRQWPIYGLNDTSVMKRNHSRISRGATVALSNIRNSVVSHGAVIERGAVIENSVVLPGAHVGRNACLRNAIVAERASIPADFHVGADLKADSSRFPVTPGGIAVVCGPLRHNAALPIHFRSAQPAFVAAG